MVNVKKQKRKITDFFLKNKFVFFSVKYFEYNIKNYNIKNVNNMNSNRSIFKK